MAGGVEMIRDGDPRELLRILTNGDRVFCITEYRSILTIVKSGFPYSYLGDVLGVNQGYLWHIINDPDYYPPEWVARILGIVKYKRTRRFYIYPDLDHLENTIKAIRSNMDPELIKVLRSRLDGQE